MAYSSTTGPTPGFDRADSFGHRPSRNTRADAGRDAHRPAYLRNIEAEVVRTRSPRTPDGTYAISTLQNDGSVRTFEHKAAADLGLGDVCGCFARGTMISTQGGLTAIEDMRPGMLLKTKDNGLQRLRWIGSCTKAASGKNNHDYPIRIKTDALSELRPLQDLIVSTSFRLLLTHPSCDALFGNKEMLAPANELLNGDSILPIHASDDLMFYNLMFDRHQIIEANGVETESYHPGSLSQSVMSVELKANLRQLFAHLEGDLSGIGKTARPRLKRFEAAMLRAG